MKSAADKYINKVQKKSMQEGGTMEDSTEQINEQPIVPNLHEELTDDNSYEVTMQDDSGLVKYKFSKNIII